MKTRILLLFLAFTVSFTSFSQPICGFDVVHRQTLQKDPRYFKSVEENEKRVQQYIKKNRASISARTSGVNSVIYTIPVVVHVMHTGGAVGTTYNPSDAQIQDAITYLNQVFDGSYPGTQGVGDIQIQFALAVRDPNCNATSGIIRTDASSVAGYSADGISTKPGTNPGVAEINIKNLSRWSSYQYYNIWIVHKIDGKDGTSGTFTAGYAYFPGAPTTVDGTVMLATQMKSGRKTLPHEIGHAFGLYHTFEGSADKNTCPTNNDCNVDGDRVCDTDPVTQNQLSGVYDFTCRTDENTCTGTPHNANTESNYMAYTNCTNLFTAGQKARLLANAAGPFRKSLSTSLALSPSYPIAFANPPAASCTPTTSSTGLSGHFAGILNIELNKRNLGSSSARNDNGYVSGANSCLNLIELTKGTTYSFTVNVLGANREQLKAWIDYNNDGVFDNLTEEIHSNPDIGTGVTSGEFTVPSTATLNTVLRMRVIDEVSTIYGVSAISGGCFNPAYGQAEDYPIYITGGTLPVTLVSFDGVMKNNAAFLSWKTGAAEGLRNFEIEKSTDGVSFNKIGTVSAVQQPLSNEYTYSDAQLAENNYYRIRMNELGGGHTLSQVVLVRNAGVQQSVRVVSNPFHDYIELNFSKAGSRAKLQLFNTTGALVAERMIFAPQGQVRWNLPANLGKGSYLLNVIVDGELFTNKVVKQ